MRVVLDTNILCSALITPGGLADRLYLAWRDGTFTLVSSEEQLEEFRRVTRYPKVSGLILPVNEMLFAASRDSAGLIRTALIRGDLWCADGKSWRRTMYPLWNCSCVAVSAANPASC